MNIKMTIRTLAAAVLLCPALALAQGITGDVSRCHRPGCDVTARLHLNPPPEMASVRAALFVAMTRMEGGRPDLSAGGWYDGRGWKTVSAPVAAYTGRLTRRTATVRIPGGACGLVKSAGGPPGIYALFAGWGRMDVIDLDNYRKDAANMAKDAEELEAGGDMETAAEIRRLIGEHQAALTRLEQIEVGENSAFMDAQQRGTYWNIASFDCTN